jgi:hypothetical protein
MWHLLLLRWLRNTVWCTGSGPGPIGSILRVLLVRLWVRRGRLVVLRPLLVLRVLVRPIWRSICAIMGVCGLAGVPGGLETLLLPVLLLRVCLPLMLLLLPLGRRPLLLWPLLLLGGVRYRRCVCGRPLGLRLPRRRRLPRIRQRRLVCRRHRRRGVIRQRRRGAVLIGLCKGV